MYRPSHLEDYMQGAACLSKENADTALKSSIAVFRPEFISLPASSDDSEGRSGAPPPEVIARPGVSSERSARSSRSSEWIEWERRVGHERAEIGAVSQRIEVAIGSRLRHECRRVASEGDPEVAHGPRFELLALGG